jgi:hypothetical protein
MNIRNTSGFIKPEHDSHNIKSLPGVHERNAAPVSLPRDEVMLSACPDTFPLTKNKVGRFMLEDPEGIPPYGKAEYYEPYLLISGKTNYSKGETLAPVSINFDDDWNMLNNSKNYRKRHGGNDRLVETIERHGTVYLHTHDTVIDGESLRVYQYWYYWAENPFLIDQHEHDIQHVQVYVKKNGQPKWVITQSHFSLFHYDAEPGDSSKKYDRNEIQWVGSHPRIYVGEGSHGLVADPADFTLVDRCNKPYAFEGTMPMMVNLDDPFDIMNPFPHGRDINRLIDKNGHLKNHGRGENWFVYVDSPVLLEVYRDGGYSRKKLK